MEPIGALLQRNAAARLHFRLVPDCNDPLAEVKEQAARRWVAAVNAEGTFGRWDYALATEIGRVAGILDDAVARFRA
jgi:hypothetical protein